MNKPIQNKRVNNILSFIHHNYQYKTIKILSVFLLIFFVSCSSENNNLTDPTTQSKDLAGFDLQVTYGSVVTYIGEGAISFPKIIPITNEYGEYHAYTVNGYALSMSDGSDVPDGISIDTSTGLITVDKNSKTTPPQGIQLVVTLTYTDIEDEKEKTATVEFHVVLQSDQIIFKEDMSAEARKVLSMGDVDNQYLYRINKLSSSEGVTGDIIIESTEGNIINQKNGIFAVKSTLEFDAGGGKVDIVGIGPSKSNPIDIETLPDQFKITLIVYTNGVEYDRIPDMVLSNGTEGTMGGYKAVYSWRDLTKIDNDLSGKYEMMSDIQFPSKGSFGFSNFDPISENGNPFTGTFDGQGYTISKLYINDHSPKLYVNRSGSDAVGLFATIRDATIKDLTIEHSGIYGDRYVGALVGMISPFSTTKETVIENVHVKALNDGIVYGRIYAGGITGFVARGYITNSSSHTPVYGEYHLGGMAGGAASSKVNGYSTGDVSGKEMLGGLVGDITGRINWDHNPKNLDQYSTTAVSGYSTGSVIGLQDYVGGLVGYISKPAIIRGYSTGYIAGRNSAGGLVGGISYGNINVYGYSMGSIEGGSSVGGLVGGVNTVASYAVRGYALGRVRGFSAVGGLVGRIPWSTISVVGYSRVKLFLQGGGSSGGLLIGEVGYNRRIKNYAGYYSEGESRFLEGKADSINPEVNINGSPITIGTVTENNKETHLSKFTFNDEMGGWTWVENGNWPAINIGIQGADEQPISGFVSDPTNDNVDLEFSSELRGIERIGSDTFKIAETMDGRQFREMFSITHMFDEYPTGLFVPPGKSIKVTVLENNGIFKQQPELVVGTPFRHGESSSEALISYKLFSSSPTVIKNRFSFPALLYLRFVSRFSPNQVAFVKIEGAKRAPYLILGKTTSKEFREQMTSFDGYDSITIASDRFVYVMGKDNALKFIDQDWTLLAKRLDDMVKVGRNVNGFDGSSVIHTEPSGRIMMTETEQKAYMFAAPNAIVVGSANAWQWLDINFVKNSWGLWHEIGHQMQPIPFWTDGTQEVYVNVYSLAMQRHFGQPSRLKDIWEGSKIPNYLASGRGDKDYFKDLNLFERLALYEQLRMEFGDDFFPRLHRYMRENYYPNYTSESIKNQNFIKITSIVSGTNLGDFFKAWGYDPTYPIFTDKVITDFPAPPDTLLRQGFK